MFNEAPRMTCAVLVVDKNPLVIQSLVALMRRDERFSLVSVADGARQFLDRIRGAFDVGVLGWNMPDLGGAAILSELQNASGVPPLLVYTGNGSVAVTHRARALGAAAVIPKSTTPDSLLSTIWAFGVGRPVPDRPRWPSLLSKREETILELLVCGLSNAEIGEQAHISTNTVKFHLSNVYRKIGVSSRTAAVRWFEANP